jgi:beta-glucosidase
MVPYKDHFLADARCTVERGYVAEGRIDAAVDRVLALKARVGLLGPQPPQRTASTPVATPTAGSRPGYAGRPSSTAPQLPGDAESSAAAAAGIVLLKNQRGVLPLDIGGLGGTDAVIAVIGPNAQNAGNLLGGWSYHWQGLESDTDVRACPSLRCTDYVTASPTAMEASRMFC